MDWKRKFTSRKFWLCVAAFLASVSASVAGLQTDEPFIAAIGVVCSVISAAIYATAEAAVDIGQRGDNGKTE